MVLVEMDEDEDGCSSEVVAARRYIYPFAPQIEISSLERMKARGGVYSAQAATRPGSAHNSALTPSHPSSTLWSSVLSVPLLLLKFALHARSTSGSSLWQHGILRSPGTVKLASSMMTSVSHATLAALGEVRAFTKTFLLVCEENEAVQRVRYSTTCYCVVD
jgi:hypothetical protein